jgi:aminoglycoside phosphotransferase (APT) family kinase protein
VADQPTAEVVIDEPLVRELVATLGDDLPHAVELPVAHVADGWDCSVWRLGDALAVRLPRREVVADLIAGEGRSLGEIAPRVEATGMRVPAPIVTGGPTGLYPWPWAVVPYFPGSPGLHVPRARRTSWARPLAAALTALHEPAAHWHPRNPYRGVPLADRTPVVTERLDRLAAVLPPASHAALVDAWRDGVEAAPWGGPPVWIHGDAHPGNLIARDGELVAIIDFVDITGGDPAYDLAAAWLVFDASGRRNFVHASPHVDVDTWVRARAWAAAMAAMLLVCSDDNPDYAQLARETLSEVATPSD